MSTLQRVLNRTGLAVRKSVDFTVGTVDGRTKGWLTTGRVALAAGFQGHKVKFNKDVDSKDAFQKKVDAYIKANPA
jgi:hypothetical protein